MSFETIIVISLILSIDSFSASLACGTLINKSTKRKYFHIPLSLSLFHGVFLLLGFKTGLILDTFIASIDHCFALFLLTFVGLKMIIQIKNGDYKEKLKLLSLSNILSISFATNIDALITGVTFAFLETNIVSAVVILVMITVSLSTLGLIVGSRVKKKFLNNASVFGGIVLIFLGIKILIEHTCF